MASTVCLPFYWIQIFQWNRASIASCLHLDHKPSYYWARGKSRFFRCRTFGDYIQYVTTCLLSLSKSHVNIVPLICVYAHKELGARSVTPHNLELFLVCLIACFSVARSVLPYELYVHVCVYRSKPRRHPLNLCRGQVLTNSVIPLFLLFSFYLKKLVMEP